MSNKYTRKPSLSSLLETTALAAAAEVVGALLQQAPSSPPAVVVDHGLCARCGDHRTTHATPLRAGGVHLLCASCRAARIVGGAL